MNATASSRRRAQLIVRSTFMATLSVCHMLTICVAGLGESLGLSTICNDASRVTLIEASPSSARKTHRVSSRITTSPTLSLTTAGMPAIEPPVTPRFGKTADAVGVLRECRRRCVEGTQDEHRIREGLSGVGECGNQIQHVRSRGAARGDRRDPIRDGCGIFARQSGK